MDPVSLGMTAAIGAGMTAGSKVIGGIGQSNADKFQAKNLEEQASAGRLKAAQTGTQLTQRLAMQLGNIDATRAAMHDDPTSPTGAAIRDWQEDVGTQQKTTAVNNILAQADVDEAGAAYERNAAKYALLGGALGAGGSLFGALGKTDWGAFGFGSSSGSGLGGAAAGGSLVGGM